ncbi:flavin reductase family protein [Parapedobacter sp. ISTM3]|uniref:flavin reductase family protein n=1 Tax=Parapedobacter sp. ISTM3 TaxID=2800130 RepID=UPI001903BC25|nr:flavin reductase family protein [Parapedobacter sp. ISTM3]MBK1441673.1 flavin reductase family protein [Parapedobacter sp. ISTM3]
MENFPLNKVVRLIEPGPVVMVSTLQQGHANLMTMGFHMMMQHDPPLIGAIVGPWDHSYHALRANKECVIAIPGVDLIDKVVDIGNCSGNEVDKFARFGFTPRKAKHVAPPLVVECLANIECRVADMQLVDQYDFFILEAVQAWINPHRKEQRTFHHKGDGTFSVSGRTLNRQDRMVRWKQFQD